MIDLAFLRAQIDFDAVQARVRQRLVQLGDGPALLRFFKHYASWNGCFANGVAALTCLVGNEREMFLEPGFPRAVADRSNYIASFFFDAARDEYDDHINPERDSHRCMAQAALLCIKDYFALPDTLLDEPDLPELEAINRAVLAGYRGEAQSAGGPVARTFAAIGYHLGSELLADGEFSTIDETLRREHDALVQHLMRRTVTLAGGTHRCYAWVGVHSGHGGGVEAEHFDHAMHGAQLALQYLAKGSTTEATAALVKGFQAFDRDHASFFALP